MTRRSPYSANDPMLARKPADLEAWLNRGASPFGCFTVTDALVTLLVAFAIGAMVAVL